MREGGDVFPIKAGQLHHHHHHPHHGHAAQQPLVLDPVSALDGSVNKIKPSQQIPITTFWNYVEPFFKPITEADLKALQEAPAMDPAPYIIPPLGRHYREQWLDEDKQLMGAGVGGAGTGVTESAKKASKPKKGSAAAAAAAAAEDVVSFPPELLCRPLTEKLMAAMIEDDENGGQSATIASATAPASTAAATEVNSDADEGSTMDREPSLIESCEEMYDMEERLKRELRFIGLLPDEEVRTSLCFSTYGANE